jgi:hypothetical protein
MSKPEQKYTEQGLRRTAGIGALRKLWGMADTESRADATGLQLMRHALIALLVLLCFILPCFIAYRLGVI